MTDIEVVDINDNTNKEDIKGNVKEEIKENVKEEVSDKTEKKKVRKDLKEKGTCPDCGMEMTQHSLRYTHKKYCKAKQISIETVENKTLDKIEEEKVETPPPSPPKLQRAISRIADAVPVVQEPTDDQIAQYLLNKKKALMAKKKEKCLY